MDLGLKDVPAAVAAASRGLGYATALELAREGARVAICARHREEVESAASSIRRQTGAVVEPVTADVATTEGAETFVRASVDSLGGLGVLVANAGGPPTGSVASFDDDTWVQAFGLNFMSTVRMVREALPHLTASPWGRVLVITSTAAKQPIAGLGLSNSMRAAASGFAKTLSAEVAAKGVTVNCIMPGSILTDRWRSLAGVPADAGPDHPALEHVAQQVPVGRLGSTEEFAAVAAFLCSERASYVTGVSIQVDGGMTRSLF
ncbi:MAG TPA: SDR family oxidoreductase [Actinomycetota bacterium]|nr:SDR family oxidoreductase [Actinomycetota bacterium]